MLESCRNCPTNNAAPYLWFWKNKDSAFGTWYYRQTFSNKFLENYRKLAWLIGILSSVTPVVFHSHVLMRLQTCPINWVGEGGGELWLRFIAGRRTWMFKILRILGEGRWFPRARFLKGRWALMRIKILFHFLYLPSYALLRVTFLLS